MKIFRTSIGLGCAVLAVSFTACKSRDFNKNANVKSTGDSQNTALDTQYDWWKLDYPDYEAIISATHDYEKQNPKATNRDRNLFIKKLLDAKHLEKDHRESDGPFASIVEHQKDAIAKKRPLAWLTLPRPWERFIAPWHALNSDETQLWKSGNGIFEGEVVGFKVLVLARFARQVNHAFYDENVQHNGNGDALMHSFWNALMVKYVGMEAAEKWSMAHETGNLGGGKGLLDDLEASNKLANGAARTDGQPVEEFMMDENNNIIGRAMGANSTDLDGKEILTDEQIAKNLVQKISDGKLIQIVESKDEDGKTLMKLVPSDASGMRANVDFSELKGLMQKTIDLFPTELSKK